MLLKLSETKSGFNGLHSTQHMHGYAFGLKEHNPNTTKIAYEYIVLNILVTPHTFICQSFVPFLFWPGILIETLHVFGEKQSPKSPPAVVLKGSETVLS